MALCYGSPRGLRHCASRSVNEKAHERRPGLAQGGAGLGGGPVSLSTRALSPAYGCSFFVYVMSPGQAVSEAFNPAFVSDVSCTGSTRPPVQDSSPRFSPVPCHPQEMWTVQRGCMRKRSLPAGHAAGRSHWHASRRECGATCPLAHVDSGTGNARASSTELLTRARPNHALPQKRNSSFVIDSQRSALGCTKQLPSEHRFSSSRKYPLR